MSVKPGGQRARAGRQHHAGSLADGTNSGQGSAPLSDTFVAEMEAPPVSRAGRRVTAPTDISRMEVRRSSRVASRAPPIPEPPAADTHPGRRQVVNHGFRILASVVEAAPGPPESTDRASVLAGNAGGFRDISIPQLVPEVSGSGLTGRKRAATSAAPG
ncbi:hypothetical protein BYT27DRAFT_7006189, partial [Phlegmacium glaucopus]